MSAAIVEDMKTRYALQLLLLSAVWGVSFLMICVAASVDGYDARLANLSRTTPWWHYTTIRGVQDRLIEALGLEAEYRGTPGMSQ